MPSEHSGVSGEVAQAESRPLSRPRFGLALRRPNLSGLRAKLIVPYALLTVLLAMVGIFIVTRLVASSVRERFANQLNAASGVANDGLVRREQLQLNNLRLLRFALGVPEAMAQRDAEALEAILLPLMLNDNVQAMTAVDVQGVEILSLIQDPALQDYVRSVGQAVLSNQPLVQKVLAGRVDDLGDKYAEFVQLPDGTVYLFTSAPVTDDLTGALIGALMVGTRLDSLLSELSAQASAGVVVLDAQGEALGATLQPVEGLVVFNLDASTAATLDETHTRELSLSGRPYQVTFAPLKVRQVPVGVLGVFLPSNYLVSTEATSRDTFSLIFALGTLAVILLGYFLSQSIARPILRLRAISQAVASGDLQQETGLRRADEIGELASAFDTMTDRLRERTDEAARLYAETVRLYNETVERNTELAEINLQLQATQQQLIQSEKLAAVGQLTAGIVHDVKNPLAVIKGLAEVLLEEDSLDAGTRKQLQVIRDSAGRANRIVTDLLKFARQSKLEKNVQDIRQSIEAAQRLTSYLAREAHVEMALELPPDSVMVAYDYQQIEQVLINLIQNAIQATARGGKLHISVGQTPETVSIAVRDTGVGIPAENIGRIFDPFFTTKGEGEGTGLGLSVSYGIVSNHGGRIDVDSKVGEGTTFTVVLPVHQPNGG
jgi:signal transduction histidine kinase